jgi:hypothetical protein
MTKSITLSPTKKFRRYVLSTKKDLTRIIFYQYNTGLKFRDILASCVDVS